MIIDRYRDHNPDDDQCNHDEHHSVLPFLSRQTPAQILHLPTHQQKISFYRIES
jgi:hypothetical protein